MDRLAIGSMMVADADGRLLGMFTLKEAPGKVALAQPDIHPAHRRIHEHRIPEAVARRAGVRGGVGDGAPWPAPPAAGTGRAAGGGGVGLQSSVAARRKKERQISARIRVAERDEELRDCALNIRQAVERLLAEGATAEYLTRFLLHHERPPHPAHHRLEFGAKAPRHALCWIALGSEGRFEQTLASDQDNALIFAADTDPDAARRVMAAALACRQ
ncbi:MAG: DUF294 nucleotidyltransferase-like domain-containing protein [Gammaproteobacteria bacterium]